MTEAMKYSQHETFFWLNDAMQLEKTYSILQGVEKREAASYSPEIQNYCKVRQSLDSARAMMTRLVRSEASIADFEKKGSGNGKILVGDHRLDERKVALQIVKSSCSLQHRVVSLAIETARRQNDFNFFKDLANAGLGDRVPEIESQRISDIGHFLVANWCGRWYGPQGEYGRWFDWLKAAKIGEWNDSGLFIWEKYQPVFFMPPLCFFSNCALAIFVALALGREKGSQDTSAAAIRKWVSRLGLRRAQQIREVKSYNDGINFRA